MCKNIYNLCLVCFKTISTKTQPCVLNCTLIEKKIIYKICELCYQNQKAPFPFLKLDKLIRPDSNWVDEIASVQLYQEQRRCRCESYEQFHAHVFDSIDVPLAPGTVEEHDFTTHTFETDRSLFANYRQEMTRLNTYYPNVRHSYDIFENEMFIRLSVTKRGRSPS